GIQCPCRWRLGRLPGVAVPQSRRQLPPAARSPAGVPPVPAARGPRRLRRAGRTDSVTVDPHKLGYLPYGAGAFICRDHRATALLAESADYVFHEDAARDGRSEEYL